MIIWLIGLSGAGKTTLGKKLEEYYKNLGKKTIFIDGDEVRNFFNSDLGYSKKDRTENIKRIQLATYFLSKTDLITIVCNISPFEELRNFQREKIDNYVEVYLKREIDECKENDVKDMYKTNIGKTDIVGDDLQFDEPLKTDLICNTSKESIIESLKKIIAFTEQKFMEMKN